MKKMNAYKRIRKAMIDRERSMFSLVRKANNEGFGYSHFYEGVPTVATMNAIDRLVEKGRIKYRRTKRKGMYSHNGYWIVKKGK